MSTEELDIYGPYSELYPDNEPIIISFYIEDVQIITNCVNGIEYGSQLIEIGKIGLLDDYVSIPQGILYVLVLITKFPNCSVAYHYHITSN